MKKTDNYPSWRFHTHLPACVVANEEEDKALGKGWHKSPADCMPDVISEPVPPPKPAGPVTVDERPTTPPAKPAPGKPEPPVKKKV